MALSLGHLLNINEISAQILAVLQLKPCLQVRTSRRQRQRETDSFLIGSDSLTCLLAPDGDAGTIYRQGNAASPCYPFFQRRFAVAAGLLTTYFLGCPNGDLAKRGRLSPSSPAAIGASSSLGQRRRLKR